MILAVTQPDRARDRGKKIQPTPVKAAALEYGIEVVQPDRVKNNEEFLERIRREAPDLIVVAAYGKILPKELLELPRLGCVNIHASLLPRFRGAAPIQRSIIEGDRETGITLIYMEEGLDTGDMIAKSSTEIGKKDADALHDELSEMGAALLMEYLPKIAAGDIAPENRTIRCPAMRRCSQKKRAEPIFEERTADRTSRARDGFLAGRDGGIRETADEDQSGRRYRGRDRCGSRHDSRCGQEGAEGGLRRGDSSDYGTSDAGKEGDDSRGLPEREQNRNRNYSEVILFQTANSRENILLRVFCNMKRFWDGIKRIADYRRSRRNSPARFAAETAGT